MKLYIDKNCNICRSFGNRIIEKNKLELKKTDKLKNDDNLPLEQKCGILHHFQAKTSVHGSHNPKLQNLELSRIFSKLSIHHLD